MSIIQATIRDTKTKGQVNDLRIKGNVPGIVYGGEQPNEKISITTKELKNLINKENFLSNTEKVFFQLCSHIKIFRTKNIWQRNSGIK